MDNCKGLANPSQHDEDRDMRGDACDPCPPYADGATVDDGDGDGISGACDPEPAIMNRLVSFQGFDVPPPATFATDGNGTWTYANDDAKLDADSGGLGMLLFASPGPDVAVMTKLTIDDLDATGTRVAGVIELFDVAANHGTSCVAIREATGTQLLLLSDTQNSNSFGSVAMPVMSGITATISTLRNGATVRCANDTDNFTGTPTFTPPSPKLGLRARGGTVRFAWLLIVGR